MSQDAWASRKYVECASTNFLCNIQNDGVIDQPSLKIEEDNRMKPKAGSKSKLQIEDISIDVEWKKIKNIHLRVCPPDGRVRISAPVRVDSVILRGFAESKLDWVRKQQARIRGSKPPEPEEFVSGEVHLFGGEHFVLEVAERVAKPEVILDGNIMRLYVRPGTTVEKRQAVLEEFYRAQLRKALPAIITGWERVMNVRVNDFGIKRMKTRWGTCNRKVGRIWINLELAKRSPECLEYIVVHEMVHLIERGHNAIFYGHMDRFLPQWHLIKKELNRTPL